MVGDIIGLSLLAMTFDVILEIVLERDIGLKSSKESGEWYHCQKMWYKGPQNLP
jgi:hypothetical protein